MTTPSNTDRSNVDDAVVAGFGDEWSRFDQQELSEAELRSMFESYFEIFPWESLTARSVGFDLGCGSGRWARLVAPRVGKLHCIDPSGDALAVARRNLHGLQNCEFIHASVGSIPLPDSSADFGYSLGVLHHVPDTAAGIRACVAKLKPGAPFLLYLYYAMDNRPAWFRAAWRVSDVPRRIISRLPSPLRYLSSQVIAATVYWPLVRAASLFRRLGLDTNNWPLSAYCGRSYYVLRTDALDRFGTRLEQRFTKVQIEQMMRDAGLRDIRFSDRPPFWTAVGIRQ